MNLPKFIKYEIFKHLSLSDIVFWQRTSKYWSNFVKQPEFWLMKLKHDYPDFDSNTLSVHSYFKVFKALTLKCGHLYVIEKAFATGLWTHKLKFPYVKEQKTVNNYISLYVGSHYLVNENGSLCVDNRYGENIHQCFDAYVEQYFTKTELMQPFLKNISDIVSTEYIGYILTTQGDLDELKRTPSFPQPAPNNLWLTLGSKHVYMNFVANSVRAVGYCMCRPLATWYLTTQNVLHVDFGPNHTIKFDQVTHVSVMKSDRGQLFYSDTNHTIWRLDGHETQKVYSSNFPFTQFSLHDKTLYLIDTSHTLHVTDLSGFSDHTLPGYAKLFNCLRTGQIYGLKRNLDLILLSDLSLVARNVVNVITNISVTNLIILPAEYFVND